MPSAEGMSMLDVVIVGAGAAGLSAALTAQEQGLNYLVLEQRSLASTVDKMPKRKRIFNTPMKLPLRGGLWFGDTTREELLDRWRAVIDQHGLHVFEREGVLEVTRRDGTFHIRSDTHTYEARRVILAIGAKGNPRKLGVLGEEDNPKVFYWLSDPDAHADQDILVVGGGDSAIEAGLALCERNRVTLSYRRGEFFRLRHRNATAIDARMREGRITVHFNSQVIGLANDHVELAAGEVRVSIPNDVVFALIGAEPPYTFLERLEVGFTDRDGVRAPRLSEHFETTVPGLYLVGAVAGRPLMKRAINQGHDVVLHITRELHGSLATTTVRGHESPGRLSASVEVNMATCNGCGVCEAACPPVFSVVDDRCMVDHTQVEAYLAHCRVAERFCPTQSIRVVQQTAQIEPSRRRVWERLRQLWQDTKAPQAPSDSASEVATNDAVEFSAAAFNGRSLGAIAALINQVPFFSGMTPAELLKRIPLFASLNEDLLAEVAAGSVLRYFPANTSIFREGDYGETFFVILSGSVHVVGTTAEGLKLFYRTQEPYDFFGEMAALTGFPRSATVTATTDTVVLEIDKEVLIDLMDESQRVKGAVQQAYTDRVLHTLFSRVPLFNGLNKTTMGVLMGKVKLQTFPSGATIIREGDPGDSLYLIRNGVVKIAKRIGDRERILAYLRDGTYFGEVALIRHEPRTATVTALTKVEVAQILREDFQALLHEYPDLLAQVQQTIRQREGQTSSLTAHPEWLDRMEILQEVVHTTDALVIDLQTCIHCDNCVRACETIHEDGVSRLLREGIKIDHYLVATSCRNCEDPLCMIECPVSAIARDEQGEVYIKDHCVGCGACVRNCPYGNINLFDPKIHAQKGSSGALWTSVLGLLGSQASKGSDAIHKPVKCDLCRDFFTPNCVRSCPTGAAMRVNPQVFFKLTP